jgi:tetratricopeptide (TPR) repeat protein
MPLPQKPKSRNAHLKQQQKSLFVGRENHLTTFRYNLTRPPEDWCFLFNIWGQGGVGKTTLLGQFRKLAGEAAFVSAKTDDTDTTVPEAMARFAAQLAQVGYPLPHFTERYTVYRQKKQELETDPEAPQGFSVLVGRAIAKAGLGFAKQVPGSGAVTPFLDEDSITNQAGEWAAYVAKKLGNKDEVQLVQSPIAVLTPLWLQDLGAIAEQANLLLVFDVYERTSNFLDDWLRQILAGDYGDLPLNVIWVIAGREELARNAWSEYESAISRISLEPFSDEEAQQYPTRQGITHPQVIEVILHLSGRLPLLVAMLAAGNPTDPSQIGDVSGDAVERFLQWVEDPTRRRLALDAALPRCLNRDLIALLHGEDHADQLFTWLRQMPFVSESAEGWVYHEVVRTLMLRHKQRETPQGWAELHSKLAAYHEHQATVLQLTEPQGWHDHNWQTHTLNALYHRLCESPQRHLPKALNQFVKALNQSGKLAAYWSETITQAGKTAESKSLQQLAICLTNILQAYREKNNEVVASELTSLLQRPELEPQNQGILFAHRAKAYYWLDRSEEAVQDYDRAISLNPQEVDVIADRARGYGQMKNYEEALNDANRAVELDPGSAWALVSRGRIYRDLERYEQALNDANCAVELDPKSAVARYSRGRTYLAMKSYEEALQDFNHAVELYHDKTAAIGQRGYTYYLLEQYDKALADFNQAIELDSKNDRAIARRAITYLILGRYSEALQDCDRAIELDKEKDWYRYLRALASLVLQRPNDAKADLNTAINLAQKKQTEKPDDCRNLFNLGIYHLVAGNLPHAKQWYQAALQQNPSPSRIRAAMGDLADLLRIFPNQTAAQQVKTVLENKLKENP